MGILGLFTPNYERYYSDLYSKLPAIKVKFRDQLNISGTKYDYRDISKVWITTTDGNYMVNPTIFYNVLEMPEDTYEVDFIGVYAIGLMELLYLVTSSSLTQDGGEAISNTTTLFDKLCSKIFTNVDDIESLYSKLFDTDISKEYDKAFNLFFSMRTDYSKMSYNLMMRYATLLMLIWLKDPKIFWELFFEIMNFIMPLSIMLLDDIIKDDDNQPHLFNYWMDIDSDLHFSRMKYNYPDTNASRYITDCRGVAIFSSLSLYYRFLYNHGYNPSNNPIITHNDIKVASYITAKIAVCIGNDFQSRFLLGEGISESSLFDLRGAYHSNIQNKTSSNKKRLPRGLYEDIVLFYIAYHDKEALDKYIVKSTDINMHYASVHTIFEMMGYIIFTNYDNILKFDTRMFETKIENLENHNSRLISEITKYKQKIDEITQNSTNNTEVTQLKEKIEDLQRIIDSKTDIIEQLNSENKDLNLIINRMYSDEETDLDNMDLEISIEEMIEYLNEFKFLMVGGRFDLLSKLHDYGWTNVDQFDGRKNLGTAQLPTADFYVLNTKFISHKVTWKVESGLDDSETVMYYNGTNPEKLIQSCYEFAIEFFK